MARRTISTTKHSVFAKMLMNLASRYHIWEVWSDFIVMFAVAISNSLDKTYAKEREATYMKIMGKYNEEERKVFPELVVEVVKALETEPEQDFLGSVFMELKLGNHWTGQFFTPYNVCRCMADITMNNVVEQIERLTIKSQV